MKRSLRTAVILSAAVVQCSHAMVTKTRPQIRQQKVQMMETVNSSRQVQERTRVSQRGKFAGLPYDDDMDDDLEFEVSGFQELQRSTGSEILDDDLQSQLDKASTTPDLFLDAHINDASYLEKIAMSSVPQQLPRPAIDALTKSRHLNRGNARVSPDEEIELAKMIQKGVKLHNLRSDFEDANGRKPNRAEWTKLAGLESTTQLRHEVSNYRRAKQLLVSANMGLVHAVVKSTYNNKGLLSFEELVQEGSLGLIRAAELFDPKRGLRFSTYATIWIKGALSNSHVGEPVKLPAREKTKWNKIVKAHDEIMEQNGGSVEPTMEEIAEHLGITVAEVLAVKNKMSAAKQVLSLDYEYQTQSRGGGENGSLNKMESDKAFQADSDLAERTQMRADVVAAMARNLDAREARLLRLRYGLSDGRPRTISECAEAMGLSQTYAQNIAARCLKKLREASEAESLEEYLLTIA